MYLTRTETRIARDGERFDFEILVDRKAARDFVRDFNSDFNLEADGYNEDVPVLIEYKDGSIWDSREATRKAPLNNIASIISVGGWETVVFNVNIDREFEDLLG